MAESEASRSIHIPGLAQYTAQVCDVVRTFHKVRVHSQKQCTLAALCRVRGKRSNSASIPRCIRYLRATGTRLGGRLVWPTALKKLQHPACRAFLALCV